MEVYENEKEEDSEEVRGKRFQDLILLMQQVRDVERILGFTGRENDNFFGLLEMGYLLTYQTRLHCTVHCRVLIDHYVSPRAE